MKIRMIIILLIRVTLTAIMIIILRIVMQSILSNSNSLGDRKNVRITKSLNYKDSDHRAFTLRDFQLT